MDWMNEIGARAVGEKLNTVDEEIGFAHVLKAGAVTGATAAGAGAQTGSSGGGTTGINLPPPVQKVWPEILGLLKDSGVVLSDSILQKAVNEVWKLAQKYGGGATTGTTIR